MKGPDTRPKTGPETGPETGLQGGMRQGVTRRTIVIAALLLLAVLLVLDFRTSPPNPYDAPDLFAFGSGTAPSGGFCGAPAMAAGR